MDGKKNKKGGPKVSPIFFDPTSRRFALIIVLSVLFLLLVVAWTALFTRQLYLSNLLIGNGYSSLTAPEVAAVPGDLLTGQADVTGDGLGENRPPQGGTSPGTQNQGDPETVLSGPIWHAPETEVYTFVPSWSPSGIRTIQENFASIDVIVPERYGISPEGNALTELATDNQTELRNFIYANRSNKRLLPLVSLGAFQEGRVETLLGSHEAAATLIGSAIDRVRQDDLDGICFDFTGASPQSSTAIVSFATLFKTEMDAIYRESCIVAGMGDALLAHPQVNDLADKLIVLGYQEPGPFSPPAPLASQDWFDTTLIELAARIEPEKLVIGIGGLGFDWVSGTSQPQPVDFFDVTAAAQDYSALITTDPSSLNTALTYSDANGRRHQIWLLDALSAHNQMLSISSTDVGGIAIWPLRHEDPGVWKLVNPGVAPMTAAAHLKHIQPAFDVRYLGKGALLTIVNQAKDGARNVVVDPDSGLITGVDYPKLPRAFTINRTGDPGSKSAILTFDDGPSKEFTPKILNILKEYNVPAVFFVVGTRVLEHPELVRRILSEGHELGVHTYTHPNLDSISDVRLRFELHASQELLASVTNQTTSLFRAPYGIDENPKTAGEAKALKLIAQEGYVVVGVDIDSQDWTLPGADKIVDNVLGGLMAGSGNVVLLHDDGGDRSKTVAALGDVIEQLQAHGFNFVTLADVMDAEKRALAGDNAAGRHWLSQLSFNSIRLLNFAITGIFFVLILAGIARSLIVIVLALIKNHRPHESIAATVPVTVAIPAYCEETVIAATVQSVLASDYPNFDIIVVDDGSTDGTASVVREEFRSEPRVRLITQTNNGKAEALNHAFSVTDSPIVVAIDADTVISPDAISALVGHFHDPKVGAVAGNVKVGNRRNLLTRLQAVEYISSQNLDRRAYEVLNGIMVVPGSIGAWRKSAVEAAGGYTTQTLVEDADISVSIIRAGYRVIFETKAHAYTEAPETIRQWVRQRLRWNFGMLQIAWKHKGAFFERRAVGLVSIPDLIIFGAFVSLFAPLADFVLISSVFQVVSGLIRDPVSTFDPVSLAVIGAYLAYLLSDLVLAALAFSLEPEEDKKLLVWVLTQRFFYRQIHWFVALRSIARALTGRFTGWRKVTRTASVSAGQALTTPRAGRRFVETKRHVSQK